MSQTLSEQRDQARIERIRGSLSRLAGDDVAAQLQGFRAESAELERQQEIADATSELAARLRASQQERRRYRSAPDLTRRERKALDAMAPASSPPSSLPAPSSSSSKPAKRKRTAHEQYQADLRWQRARKKELETNPNAPADYAVIPRDVWRLGRLCMGSRRAAWFELAGHGNRAAAGAIRRAAFAGGRQWGSDRAHRIVVLGLCMLALARPTKRKGRFAYVFDHIPRQALCELLRNPHTGRAPGLTALSGTHRTDGDLINGQIGYLRALERVHFMYRLQEDKPSRHNPHQAPSCSQYWLVSHSAYVIGDALAELLQLIDESYALQDERPPARAP